MTFHLPRDRRNREGGELSSACRVIALDCVQQADGARLYEVVVLGTPAVMAVRQRLDQREIQLNEAIPSPRIAVRPIRTQ